MKKLLISLLSCLTITTCFAIEPIVLKGEGTSNDPKVAKYIATRQIEEQYKNLPDDILKFSSVFREEEKPYNYMKIIYNDVIICNFTIQGQEITGKPVYFSRKVTDVIPCKESSEGDTYKISCTINDGVIELIKTVLLKAEPIDTEHCENHFYNEFIDIRTGESKTQHGIIFGKWKYKDYFDKGGTFYSIDYGKDTWYGDHKEKLFYFGNISKRDFETNKHILKNKIEEQF